VSKRRNLLDDIVEGARRVLEQIVNPDKGKKRAPVPVPVRPQKRPPTSNYPTYH